MLGYTLYNCVCDQVKDSSSSTFIFKFESRSTFHEFTELKTKMTL